MQERGCFAILKVCQAPDDTAEAAKSTRLGDHFGRIFFGNVKNSLLSEIQGNNLADSDEPFVILSYVPLNGHELTGQN